MFDRNETVKSKWERKNKIFMNLIKKIKICNVARKILRNKSGKRSEFSRAFYVMQRNVGTIARGQFSAIHVNTGLQIRVNEFIIILLCALLRCWRKNLLRFISFARVQFLFIYILYSPRFILWHCCFFSLFVDLFFKAFSSETVLFFCYWFWMGQISTKWRD